MSNPTQLFKPQWAYETPEDYRDETHLVPFAFTVSGSGLPGLSTNLPWSLDDDVPFILRGIFFPQLGVGGNDVTPGFLRIRDSQGNPLSDGLVLSLGAWCQNAPFGSQGGAFGFPIEPDVECAPGGTVLYDFRLSTNAVPAVFFINGLAGSIIFLRNIFGTAGNDGTTIELIDPGANNIPLSVAVVAPKHVQVTLATGGGGAITSTFYQIAAIINATPGTAALIVAVAQGDIAQLAFPQGQTVLAGGMAAQDVLVRGTLIGIKRFPECNQ